MGAVRLSTPRRATGLALGVLVLTGLLPGGASSLPGQCATLTLPIQDGMSVGTMGSFLNTTSERVVALYDTRNPVANAPGFDTNWPCPQTWNEIPLGTNTWNKGNLGEVFGLCLDDAANPSIYVAATAIYGGGFFGPSGAGGVYRLDGTTGAITPFATIPAGGSSLGNIDHDASVGGGHFYVSSFDDGLIYQLNPAGGIVGTYDHGVAGLTAAALPTVPDDPSLALTPMGRRVWGLQVNEVEDRLYYAVWNEVGADVAGVANQIWSVDLDNVTRSPIPATIQLEVSIAPFASMWSGPMVQPVADIAFDDAGTRMVAGQRSMGGDGLWPSSHVSRVLEYTGATGGWAAAPDDKNLVGNYGNGSNAAGGVDFDCEGNVWATGDALHFMAPDTIYGMQRIPAAGGSTVSPFAQTSYLVDFDCNDTNFDVDKTYLGDVEHKRGGCTTCVVEDDEVLCDSTAPGSFSYTFTVTNNSGIAADRIKLFASGFTFTPDTIFQNIPPGGSATFTVQVSGAAAGTTICFEVWLMSGPADQCCVIDHCIELPHCCAELGVVDITCDPASPGLYQFSFTITNLSTIPVDRIFFWPMPQPVPGYMFIPDDWSAPADFPGPLLNGQTTPTLSTLISGGAPGSTICFEISIHDSTTGDCCFQRVCIALPDCGGGCDKPDECAIDGVKPCEGQPGAPGHQAVITATICNYCANTDVEFDWSIDGTVGGPCPVQYLTPASFSPSSGVTPPVPPGGCFTFTIVVDCANIPPAAYACFEITFTNLATGTSTACHGRVYHPDAAGGGVGGVDVTPNQPVIQVPVGTTRLVSFQLERLGGPVPTTVMISENAPPVTVIPQVSLDASTPGTPAVYPLDLPPGSTATIVTQVSIPVHDPLAIHTIFLLADANGDGSLDPLLSANLRSVMPGDCNGNGIPDDVEIVLGLEADLDGDGVPDSCGAGVPTFIRGDANADGLFDIGDPIFSLGYIFGGGETPPCLEAANSNADSGVDIADAIFTLGALFSGGPPPAAPHPGCGTAPPTPLGCSEPTCP